MLEKFIQLLENEVSNHSIYVWGGNGQTTPTINEEWIRKAEKTTGGYSSGLSYADAAIATYRKAVAAGYEKKLKAFDCSGLGFYCLKQLGLQKTDINANGLKGKCKLIKKGELKKGCFVFKVNSSGVANHIGYVVDDSLNVIEAKGRKDGVVKRPLAAGGWEVYGIPTYFAAEIEKPVTQPSISFKRLLKQTKPYMKGEDIKKLQEELNKKGFNCGKADGIYGSKTTAAVKLFQRRYHLLIDGKAGKQTIQKLGYKWEG